MRLVRNQSRAWHFALPMLALLLEVKGQYFRYGSLRWHQVGVDPTGITVRFRLSTAWKRDYFDKVGGCTDCTGQAVFPNCPDEQESCDAPVVGDSVTLYDDPVDTPPVGLTFSFGANPDDYLTGQFGFGMPACLESTPTRCIPGRVVESFENTTTSPTAEDDALHLVYVVTELDYKYPLETRSYTAGFQGCCRIGQADNELRNNANGAWFLRTVVSLTDTSETMATGTAASAFINHIPTVNAIKGRPSSFTVHAFDPASRPVSFSLGTNDDQGIGLNPNSPPPFGNTMAATIDEITGQVTFPASAATSYEQFYHMVVVATVVGPCTEFDSTTPTMCLDPEGAPQTNTITTIVDFMVHVIYAGFTGLPPTASCSQGDSGLPRGSQVCNNQPLLTIPRTPQRFICGETNSFIVKLQDGTGGDKSVSWTAGAFAIRHRQRLVLEVAYPTAAETLPSFPLEDDVCCVREYAGINASTGQPNQATGVFRWHPMCERLEDNVLYSYGGRHRLEVYSACFVGVDEGGWTSFLGKLTSPPGCVAIHLLRCTKPTILLHRTTYPPTNATSRTYTIFVATNLTFHLNATDDLQTRRLTISNTADPGVPAVGAVWQPESCAASLPPSGPVVCNPTTRAFTFNAELVHAGTVTRLCFEAVNDQVECPRFRPNTGNLTQEYGTHAGPAVTVSQASEPLCVWLDVPGPILEWIDPSPAEGSTITTFMGCPLEMTFAAIDQRNYFDLLIRPSEVCPVPRALLACSPPALTLTDAPVQDTGLPDGVALEPDVCAFLPSVPPPQRVAEGIGRCPYVTRVLKWVPSRQQTGLRTRVCMETSSMGGQPSRRCFVFHVGKCRYCAQQGETLQSIAESFDTDWLQIWTANAQLYDPGAVDLYHLLNIGSLYPARAGDTLTSLSQRFRTEIGALRAANPDVTSDTAELSEPQLICVLGGMCNVAEYGPAP